MLLYKLQICSILVKPELFIYVADLHTVLRQLISADGTILFLKLNLYNLINTIVLAVLTDNMFNFT